MKYKISNVYIVIDNISISIGTVLGEENDPYSLYNTEIITNTEYNNGLKTGKYGYQVVDDLVYHCIGRISTVKQDMNKSVAIDKKWIDELERIGLDPNNYYYKLKEEEENKKDMKNMKSLFISCPFTGRTDDEISKALEILKRKAEEHFGEEFEAVHNFFAKGDSNEIKVPEEARINDVYYLGEALKKMSACDYYIGLKDPKTSKGCTVENHIAELYFNDNIKFLIDFDEVEKELQNHGKKYIIVDDNIVNFNGFKLSRIVALKDFADVKKGSIGGYVESEKNLSQEGDCWIYDNAMVFDDASVTGNAKVRNKAIVMHNATVFGNAIIEQNATVTDYSQVYENATISGNVVLFDNAIVHDNARLYEDVKVFKDAVIGRNTVETGNSIRINSLSVTFIDKIMK